MDNSISKYLDLFYKNKFTKYKKIIFNSIKLYIITDNV